MTPRIRTAADLTAYRESIGPVEPPEMCEKLEVTDWNGKPISVRVTGWWRPILAYTIRPEIKHCALHRNGRNTLVVQYGARSSIRPTASVPHLRHRRSYSFDSNRWLAKWRSEWDEEEWTEAESKGFILLRPCLRADATHVEHYAVCGGFERIDRVKRCHTLCWTAEQQAQEIESHTRWAMRADRFDRATARP